MANNINEVEINFDEITVTIGNDEEITLNINQVSGSIGNGNMLKSVYDTNENGIVDGAENVTDGNVTSSASEVRTHLDNVSNPHNVHLSQLNDVSLNTISDGQTLVYNATTSLWENVDIATQVELDAHTSDLTIHFTQADISITHDQISDWSTQFTTDFDTALASKTTDDLAEGITNLYYTDAKVSANADVSANTTHRNTTGNPHSATTTDIPEGTNLYYTDSRAKDAIGGVLIDTASIDFTYDTTLQQISAEVRVDGTTIEIDGTNGYIKVVDDIYAPIAHTHLKADITDFVETDYVHTFNDETIAGIKTFSDNVIINGDLTVNGTLTSVNSDDLNITDNIIVVNSGETGAGVTLGTSGISVDRGTEADAQFLFDESVDRWKIGLEGGTFDYLVSDNSTSLVYYYTKADSDARFAPIVHTHNDEEIFVNSTSATYKTTEDVLNTSLSVGRIDGGTFTDNGDGTLTVGAGSCYIKTTNSDIGSVIVVDFPETILTPTDGVENYVYVDYNLGSPVVTISTIPPSDHNTMIMLGQVFRSGLELHMIEAGQVTANFNSKIFFKSIDIYGKFQRADGIVISEKPSLTFAITDGSVYAGIIKVLIPAVDTSVSDTFSYWYRDGAGGWTEVTAQTTIDNLHYDDGSGTLAELSDPVGWRTYYGVHWVYRGIDGHTHVIYGIGNYVLTEAQNATPPSDIPPVIESMGGLIGKIIVEKNATSFESVESAFVVKFTPSVVSEHNLLGGLQGGTVDEYYHLTQSEHDTLTTGVDATLLHIHDDRYYTETEADGLFVHLTGDESISGVKTFLDGIIVSGYGVTTKFVSSDIVPSVSPYEVTITHNLGDDSPIIQVYYNNHLIEPYDVEIVDVNTVIITVDSTLAGETIKTVIIGNI